MISPRPDSDVRTIAGRYRLSVVLGRGGMGTVWLAEDLLLRREVAVKELLFPDTLDPEQQEELRRRSLREAQAAARITSPHAVKVFDVVTDGGRPWIVMERHHGRTLSEIIRADGPRSAAETARIGLAVLDALETAHAAGIVHRDVKPSNVLVRDDGHVTLTDFGIARGIEDTTITRTGMIVGSPAYVSPERAAGSPALPPSDLWALGATLYSTVEGHPPYDRGDPMRTLAAVLYEQPEPCSAAGPLAPIIRALLAKNPADRPGIPAARTALAAVARATEAGTRTLPMPEAVRMGDRTVVLAPGVPGPPAAPLPIRQRPPLRSAPPSGRPRRQPAGRIGAVLVVLALVTGGTTFLLSQREPPGPGQAAAGPVGAASPATTSPRAAAPGGPAGAVAAGRRATAAPTAAPTSVRTSDDAATNGLVRYTDPKVGWSIGMPAQWRVRQRGRLTDLVDPAGGRYLRIDTVAEAGPSAVGAWRDLEPAFARKHAGYFRIQLETISWRGFDDVADWEYGYRNDGVRLRAVDRGIVSGGRGYALNFQSREDQWTSSEPLREALFASFEPAE